MENKELIKLKKMFNGFHKFSIGENWPDRPDDDKLSDILTEFAQIDGDMGSWEHSILNNEPLNWEFIKADEKMNRELASIKPKTEADKKALEFCKEFKERVDTIIIQLQKFKPIR